MSISKEIRKRLEEAGKRFHGNDNIAEYIKEGELQKLQDEVTEKFQDVLDTLVTVSYTHLTLPTKRIV